MFSCTIFKVCATAQGGAHTCTGNSCCAFQNEEIHNWALSGGSMKIYLGLIGRRAAETARYNRNKMFLGESGGKKKHRAR